MSAVGAPQDAFVGRLARLSSRLRGRIKRLAHRFAPEQAAQLPGKACMTGTIGDLLDQQMPVG